MQDQYHKFIFNIRWKFSFTLSTKLKKKSERKGDFRKENTNGYQKPKFRYPFYELFTSTWMHLNFCVLYNKFHIYIAWPFFYKQDTCILQTRENPIGASH